MHTLIELTNQLNDYLQTSLFIDYCPNGLQVEGKLKVRKVATAVSASLNVIEEAVQQEVDALIVHHGLFWTKEPYYPISGTKKAKLLKLLTHGISLLAYHLPLDAHQLIGNNWKAAIDLGWSDLKPFFQTNGQWIGVQGRIKPQCREEFQSLLESYYGQKAVIAPGGKDKISTAALISGGAYRQMEDAARLGIDAFITGNFDEPAWHTAKEEKINFFALGHSATEKIGPRALADYLRSVHNLDARFIDEINPF